MQCCHVTCELQSPAPCCPVPCCAAGTTLTMAVLSGWLLTIANTGDSNAIVDCGDDVQEITFSHRIQVRQQDCNVV